MEKDCGERENGSGFQLLGCGRIGANKQGILEEHDFWPYSPYGGKELMTTDWFAKFQYQKTSEIKESESLHNFNRHLARIDDAINLCQL